MGQNRPGAFLNQVVQLQSRMEPLAFLKLVQQIELLLGRKRDINWGPRTLDIDILLAGDQVIELPELQVPHPMMTQRRFTLVPLASIAGNEMHPGLNLTFNQLLEQCEDPLPVKLYTDKPVFPVFSGGTAPYWAQLVAYPAMIFDLHEHFIKQTYRNRINISGANGPLNLILPIIHAEGAKQAMHEVRLNYETDWQRQHWQSLVSAYKNSPFFEYYDYLVEPLFTRRYDLLAEWNLECMRIVAKAMKVNPDWEISSAYMEGIKDDYRQAFSAKQKSAIGLPAYKQVFDHKSGFIDGLHVFDLLFNLGPQSQSWLLESARELLLHVNTPFLRISLYAR